MPNNKGENTNTNKDKPESSTFRDRMKTEENDDTDPGKKSNRTSFVNKNNESPRVSFDPVNSIMKEIEKELSVTNGNPNSLDEAKVMLNLKNQIIDKLQKFMTSSNNSFHIQSPFTAYTAEKDVNAYEVDYLKSENERLENKVLILQSEFDLERVRSEQLNEAYQEAKKQIAAHKKLCEELEVANRNALKAENENWVRITDELKGTQEKEMIRKQDEVRKLHDFLAGWIFKYMELQETKGVTPSHQEKILFETFKRKEIPDKALLERALTSVKHTSNNNTTSTSNMKTPMTPSERKSIEQLRKN
jgi:hypothetical protein